jgi:Tol biopolymer transport system component
MRHSRALLPYLATAALIVVGSVALLLSTVDGRESTPGGASSSRAAPQLSPTGRLAYWRQNYGGAFALWAANTDGSQARPLTTPGAQTSRPFGTRWTPNGEGIAFITDFGIVRIGLDGSRSDILLAPAARNSGFRVLDHRWSPSGSRVAATVYRSGDGKSEVYVATLDRGELARAGDLGSTNAFVGDWISEDEVLVESESGALGALRPETSTIRKLIDQSAASPFIDGGRVFFLAGPIGGSDRSGIFVASPSVWSVLPDGSDARREARLQLGGNLRLDGLWPDGRYLMHVSRDATQYLAGPNLLPLAPQSLLRRAVVNANRRSAVGLGGPRIVRIDLTRGFSPPENAFVVLLDGVISADAWVRRGQLP